MVVCGGNKDNRQPLRHMRADEGASWAKRYAATQGFVSKPQAQITLMNGKLVQNPGWDANDPTTQYKSIY